MGGPGIGPAPGEPHSGIAPGSGPSGKLVGLPTAAAGPNAAGRNLRYLAAWLAAALPVFVIITLLWRNYDATAPFAYYALAAFALAFPVIVRRLDVPRGTEFVYFLLLAGLAFGVVSIITGWGNGLTDEPFTTPRFASFVLSGHDPYTTQLVFSYQEYGHTIQSQSYYLYLPLLMFLQIPGIGYKWFALGCWALMVLLTRKRFDAATMLAQPYVLVIAASGYNDLVVLLLLTLGFVGLGGRRQKWAEYLSLGCKQFANVFVFVYYLVRRRWVDSAVTLAVSAAFLVPFLVWGGTAVICPAVFADRLICSSSGNASILLNYPVWVVWAFSVFYVPLRAWIRDRPGPQSSATRRSGERPRRGQYASLPALAVVVASAVSIGLVVFDLATVAFGPGMVPVLASGALAALGSLGWGAAWGRWWQTVPSRAPGDGSDTGRRVVTQLAVPAIAVPVLAGWAASGGAPLAGAALGLGLGFLVSAVGIWRWDLGEPAGPNGWIRSGTGPSSVGEPVHAGP